jgi:hypothetical protein
MGAILQQRRMGQVAWAVATPPTLTSSSRGGMVCLVVGMREGQGEGLGSRSSHTGHHRRQQRQQQQRVMGPGPPGGQCRQQQGGTTKGHPLSSNSSSSSINLGMPRPQGGITRHLEVTHSSHSSHHTAMVLRGSSGWVRRIAEMVV